MRKDIDALKKKTEEIPYLQRKVATLTNELSALRQNKNTVIPNTNQSKKRSYAGVAAAMRLPLKLQLNHSESTRGVTSVTSNTERCTRANIQ